MNIKKFLNKEMDSEMEKTLDMVIAERFVSISAGRSQEQKDRISEKGRKIEEMAREYYRGDEEECEKFLNMLVEQECEETENYYLHGLRDGIRIMKALVM
mgnify:CR=1 FL=1